MEPIRDKPAPVTRWIKRMMMGDDVPLCEAGRLRRDRLDVVCEKGTAGYGIVRDQSRSVNILDTRVSILLPLPLRITRRKQGFSVIVRYRFFVNTFKGPSGNYAIIFQVP